MDWFFENLGKFVSLIVFLLYIYASLRGSKDEEAAERDPEAEARARKIQEEIRRKILDRQQNEQSKTGAERNEPLPEQTAESRYERRETERPVYEESPRHHVPTDTWNAEPELVSREEIQAAVDPFAEERRKIEEKSRKAAALREKAGLKKKSIRLTKKRKRRNTASAGQAGSIADRVRSDLRHPESLKSAFVLKEVLEKPVGLR